MGSPTGVLLRHLRLLFWCSIVYQRVEALGNQAASSRTSFESRITYHICRTNFVLLCPSWSEYLQQELSPRSQANILIQSLLTKTLSRIGPYFAWIERFTATATAARLWPQAIGHAVGALTGSQLISRYMQSEISASITHLLTLYWDTDTYQNINFWGVDFSLLIPTHVGAMGR